MLNGLVKKYALSTASHTQASFTQLELQELEIDKFFSYFIYTSDIGYRKESPEFYKQCLRITGKEGKEEDCIMIGDNYDVDFLVPRTLGMKSIWIRNPITQDRYPMAKFSRESLPLKEFDALPALIEELFPGE